jgi:hypothetical protein
MGKFVLNLPDPLNFQELALELVGSGQVNGTQVGGSMGTT